MVCLVALLCYRHFYFSVHVFYVAMSCLVPFPAKINSSRFRRRDGNFLFGVHNSLLCKIIQIDLSYSSRRDSFQFSPLCSIFVFCLLDHGGIRPESLEYLYISSQRFLIIFYATSTSYSARVLSREMSVWPLSWVHSPSK